MSKNPIILDYKLNAGLYRSSQVTSFTLQALKDLDYEVREKLFVEQLLDIEFADSLDRGVFYIGEFGTEK